MMQTRTLFFLLLGSLALLLATPAQAAEGESALLVRTGWNPLKLSARPSVQLAELDAGVEWGLSDFWNLGVHLGGGAGPRTDEDGGFAWDSHAGVHLSTLIDALEFIPYLTLELRGGLAGFGQGVDLTPYLQASGGLGLDYRPKRSWAVGILGMGALTWAEPGIAQGYTGLLVFKAYLPYFFE